MTDEQADALPSALEEMVDFLMGKPRKDAFALLNQVITWKVGPPLSEQMDFNARLCSALRAKSFFND